MRYSILSIRRRRQLISSLFSRDCVIFPFLNRWTFRIRFHFSQQVPLCWSCEKILSSELQVDAEIAAPASKPDVHLGIAAALFHPAQRRAMDRRKMRRK